jgi:hypothetical protein
VLKWKRVGQSWFGNGFRVQQVAPTRWSLEHVNESSEPIDVGEPIAELRTLQACQHKAEALHEIERTRDLRRRLSAIGVGSWSLALIVGNPIGFIVGGVIGSAALLELLATWTDGKVGGFRSYTQ